MVSTSEQLSQLVFCAAVFREVVRLRSAVAVVSHICLVGATVAIIIVVYFVSLSKRRR